MQPDHRPSDAARSEKRGPRISDARALGKRYGLSGVVIIFHDHETAGYVSWGETKQECGWMRRYADKAYRVLQSMWASER